jgi:hypothetical protein
MNELQFSPINFHEIIQNTVIQSIQEKHAENIADFKTTKEPNEVLGDYHIMPNDFELIRDTFIMILCRDYGFLQLPIEQELRTWSNRSLFDPDDWKNVDDTHDLLVKPMQYLVTSGIAKQIETQYHTND